MVVPCSNVQGEGAQLYSHALGCQDGWRHANTADMVKGRPLVIKEEEEFVALREHGDASARLSPAPMRMDVYT